MFVTMRSAGIRGMGWDMYGCVVAVLACEGDGAEGSDWVNGMAVNLRSRCLGNQMYREETNADSRNFRGRRVMSVKPGLLAGKS